MSLYNSNSSGYFSNIAKKSYVLSKINLGKNKDLLVKTNYIFSDPDEYLKLPNETEFKYIVGKNPKGPQYDIDDKIIPYTIVGPQKFFHSKQKEFLSNSKTNKISFSSRANNTRSNNNKNSNNSNSYNLVNDNQLKEIFNRFKNVIKENRNDHRKNLLTQIDCPKVMDQYIRKPLQLQEKTLRNNMAYNNSMKTIEEAIQRKMITKMKNKSKSKPNFFTITYNSSNISKEINLFNMNELVMNSGEEYRIKNEIRNEIEKIKSQKFVLPNVNQNFQMSLRRPKNFKGVRKEYLNIGGTINHPVWCITTEKNPDYTERISNPKKDFNLTLLASKTNSLDKFLSINKKNYTTTDASLKNVIRRNNTSDYLEVKGNKLIDFEENNIKKLRGKQKKLLNFKYDLEFTKDIVFCKDYSIKNNHIIKIEEPKDQTNQE